MNNLIAGLTLGAVAMFTFYMIAIKPVDDARVREYIIAAYDIGQKEKQCYTDDMGVIRLSIHDIEDLVE